MTNTAEDLENTLTAAIDAANDLQSLEEVRVRALGKKGDITAQMKTLGQMSHEERVTAGQALNALKDRIAAHIETREKTLKKAALEERLKTETIDITLPPRPERKGSIHPISHVMEELVEIFGAMGFTVAEGPDIEDDWHNFTALNFPPGHPAREMQDTAFLPDDPDAEGAYAKKLLRTQTSNVQIRHMSAHEPPFKFISMGRTYRNEADDATHSSMFHQIECVYVDKGVHMGHLKGCLTDFLQAFFEVDDLPVQFRPSFFPFTEPSAEVGIGCFRKDGVLKLGRSDDPADQNWLEILGSGMIHPNVLKNCGMDPDEWQGFAFGCGIERIGMLKYGIPDLRKFYDSDTRWLEHYGFGVLDS